MFPIGSLISRLIKNNGRIAAIGANQRGMPAGRESFLSLGFGENMTRIISKIRIEVIITKIELKGSGAN